MNQFNLHGWSWYYHPPSLLLCIGPAGMKPIVDWYELDPVDLVSGHQVCSDGRIFAMVHKAQAVASKWMVPGKAHHELLVPYDPNDFNSYWRATGKPKQKQLTHK